MSSVTTRTTFKECKHTDVAEPATIDEEDIVYVEIEGYCRSVFCSSNSKLNRALTYNFY